MRTDHWYAKIAQSATLDAATLTAALTWFEQQYAEASAELECKGERICTIGQRLPGLVGYRHRQLQELEAIVDYLQILEDEAKGRARRHYLEHYNRTLTERTVEKYAECEPAVITVAEWRNRVALMRNCFESITKHQECLHYQLGNISRLVAAGYAEAVL